MNNNFQQQRIPVAQTVPVTMQGGQPYANANAQQQGQYMQQQQGQYMQQQQGQYVQPQQGQYMQQQQGQYMQQQQGQYVQQQQGSYGSAATGAPKAYAQQPQQQYSTSNNMETPLLAPAYVNTNRNNPHQQFAPQPQAMAAGQYMPQTVGEMMPTAPPIESCSTAGPINTNRIEQQQQAPAQQGSFASSAGPGQYFSQQEIELLNRQHALMDARKPVEGTPQGQIPVAAAASRPVPAQPVLVTQVGVPILPQARSLAVTCHDGWHGIKSCDQSLDSVEKILEFLQTHNNRPRVACRVHGHHEETRHREVKRTDSEGNDYWETETYYETVTDFDYSIDLTRFIYPFGYIQAKSGLENVPDLINRYLEDKNSLKSLQMQKEISFDFEQLRDQVHYYVRSLGWSRNLTVSFPKSNYTVRIYNDNCMSTCWENECLFCLAHVTILPCIFMRCYRDCGDHFSDGLRSYYRIDYHPLQVFHIIRPCLWCKGYTLGDAAAEMFRDFFW